MPTLASMLTIDSLAKDLGTYLDKEQINQVVDAYRFADHAHEGQKRKSGEAYITHPLAVAGILAEMHMDHQCLMAALLHDVIEDTGVAKDTLGEAFDQDVAELVDGVSKLQNIFNSRAEAQAENFQKMVLAMVKDIRVILVKLADRLHNMRTLGHLSPKKRRRIARETLEIYAPIALRLGMNNIRMEFEELGFRALYPLRSSLIEKAVKRARGNRKEVVKKIKSTLRAALKRDDINAKVIGREKHLYSIYDKMRSKRKSFNEIMDVYAFRILVDSVDSCYRTLGAVHNLYKPVAGRFKDYIAIPKANGYQSLHTTLFGMEGLPIEIQIRTYDMEQLANNGIAGHHLYKSKPGDEAVKHQRAREWMKGLLEIQQSAGNSLEFIENVKVDLFPDEVYLFSPEGEIFDLPQGSTPIDFAYAVHTDIGNRCIACRIDRKMAPLSTNLESGQTVEIITAKGARPNPDWLGFVVTGKARAGIRHALKQLQGRESRKLGKRMLKAALRQLDSSLDDIDSSRLEQVLEERKLKSLNQLLAEIGIGNQMATIIAQRLVAEDEGACHKGNDSPLAIKGTEGLVITYGKCCHPIPGDPVIGHVSAGRGMVIHLESCRNMIEALEKNEDIVAVRWGAGIDQEFSVELRVVLEHARGAIAVIASNVTSVDANIERINMIEQDAHLVVVNLIVSVRDRVHLARVIKRLRAIKGVSKIVRVKN